MESYAIENDLDGYESLTISASDWLFGIGLSVMASIIGASSKLAIRKSWLLQKRRENSIDIQDKGIENENPLQIQLASCDNAEKSHRKRSETKLWQPYLLRYLGMFGMSVLNPICCVFAMNYASPSILAPFSGLTLVWVIMFSGVVVGEKPSTSEVVAAMLIVTGEIIVAVFGDHTNDETITVEGVRLSYEDPASQMYFFGLAIYLAILTYLIKFSENPSLQRFAWGSVGGTITGPQCFLKDSLTIVKATDNYAYPWFFPVLVVLAAASSLIGLLLLTRSMKRYDATYSAAAFVGSFVISASINAACHYKTFEALESLVNYIFYPFGLLVLMIGVFILEKSPVASQENQTTTGSDKDPEDLKAPYVQVEDGSVQSGE